MNSPSDTTPNGHTPPIIDVSANFQPSGELGLYDYLEVPVGNPFDPEAHIAVMDESGVAMTGLVAGVIALGVGGEVRTTDPEAVASAVEAHPDRYFGWIGVSPLDTMAALRAIDHGITDLGFKAVHVYPHWFGISINDRLYYPLYAKCAELGVPIGLQVGSQSMRSGARLCGRPVLLDDVAFHFPSLKILGLHIGTPWAHEMTMLARNHANVYIVADAHPPRQWEPELVAYICQDEWTNKDGSRKVMWGTDWPVQMPGPSLQEVRDLGLEPEVESALTGGNAVKIFGL